jgi:glyoxylase-like metal-dependent hydrolase (beta-lactamase superfamily II)/rhodanese-related sulfurtransferase
MIFRAHYLACLSHASYLVADEVSKVAAIVDPQRDVADYLAEAQALGVSIRHVILTHFHADFVSGHLELAAATGASVHVGARGRTDYPSVPARDGGELDLGPRTKLRFLETPGHTPESICVLVFDRAKSETEPHAVLTGDTLFLGDVGRPDLMASVGVSEQELASMLYDSLHGKLLPLPDATIVYPAHGAGSLCGKALSAETSSPLGVQRKTNYALAPMTKAEFVRLVTTDQPEAPAYFGYDADLNRRARPTLDRALAASARPLSLDEALAHVAAGALLLDVRPAAEFGSGHLAGSVNVGLGGRFAQWAGTVVDPRTPIVLVAGPGRAQEAALRLGRVGFDRVAGYLADLPSAMRAHPELVRRQAKTSPIDWVRLEDSGASAASRPFVLDVRTPGEFAEGHLSGALNVPLPRLRARLAEVPRDRAVLVHCQSGSRSSIAASLLAREGYERVSDLVGGWAAYEATRTPAFPEP